MQSAADIRRVYQTHGHVVLRRARQILGNEDDAHEVLQELFVSLMERPEQFARRSSVTTFLYRAATNRCLNRLRNQKNRSRIVDAKVAPAATEEDGPKAEAATEAAEILARLPDELAHVAVYYYLDEMTHEEIATVLGCSRRRVGYLLGKLEARTEREMRV